MKFKKNNVKAVLGILFFLFVLLWFYAFATFFDLIPKKIHNEPYVSPNSSQK